MNEILTLYQYNQHYRKLEHYHANTIIHCVASGLWGSGSGNASPRLEDKFEFAIFRFIPGTGRSISSQEVFIFLELNQMRLAIRGSEPGCPYTNTKEQPRDALPTTALVVLHHAKDRMGECSKGSLAIGCSID